MILAALAAAATLAGAQTHPLEPLTVSELGDAVELIRATKIFREEAMFPVVALQEPPKAEVKAFVPGQPFSRKAFAVVFDRERNETSEAVVDLRKRALESWRVIPGVQPMFLLEEVDSVPAIVRADARWQDAMRKRGITDFEGVQIDGWAPGTLGVTTAEGPRLIRALSFYKGTSKNGYARPVEGVVALVDMNAKAVIQVYDSGVVPMSADPGAFDEDSQKPLRPQPKPLEIVQPQGPDFQLSGSEIRWQKWRLRASMHPREGLVLHEVGYEDAGVVRPVLYRAGLSEMVVPYGDPDPAWSWRNAFDEGEYGIGRLASPLEPGVDAPENAVFLDAPFADDFGRPYTLRRAVGVYERDGGLLWKHYSIETGINESRRGRELVLTSVATIGNYDYAFNWIFRQDGSLEFQAGLTGIMLAKGVEAGSDSAHAAHMHLVAPGVAAPHHQHFFNFRLDFDVDGTTNTAMELETRSMPKGKSNPHGTGMIVSETALRSEKAARRSLEASTVRRWVVRNEGSLNALGQPAGFLLLPGENTVPFTRPEALVRRRAGFIDHHLWVTAYDPEQLYAAGDYPNQSRGREGLERWSKDDEPLIGRDLVVWYTLGVTHVPRPEEWPVMPVSHAGFKLLPASFFSRNPALDVPRPPRRKK